MAINKKLIHFATKANFDTQLANSNIDDRSIIFINETGQIWTHGKFYNSALWGTNQTNYIPLTIDNTTYNLSKDGHTHSYLPLAGGTITGSVSIAGSITNLSHDGGGIFWNPYAESVSDPSDVASISVATSGGSTVMSIKQMNDATDYINFLVNSNANGVRVNGNAIYHAGNLNLNNYAPQSTISATLPATAGWYRIATSALDMSRCSARFEVDWAVSGYHGQVTMNAGVMYGQDPTLNMIHYAHYGVSLTKARIVYHTTYTGNYAYLEVYNSAAVAAVVTVQMFSTLGWSLVTPSTAGSIPSGYSSQEITFYDGIVTEGQLVSSIGTGTAPLVVSSTTAVTNLNADLLDGYHASTSATGNTIVQRDGNGYIYGVYINSSRPNETSAAASYIYDSGDGWLRKKTLANTQTEIVTKTFVESVLTGTLTSHTHNYKDLANLVVAGNEHNWIANGYSGTMWINYQDRVNRDSTAQITEYELGNGRGGYAPIKTNGFLKSGSSDLYVLLGGGGHAAISNLNVNYSSSSGNASTAGNLTTNYLPGSGSTGVEYIKVATFTSSVIWSGVTTYLTFGDIENGVIKSTLYIHYRFSDAGLTTLSVPELGWVMGDNNGIEAYMQQDGNGLISIWIKTTGTYQTLTYSWLYKYLTGTTVDETHTTAASLSGTTVVTATVKNIAHKLATSRTIWGQSFNGTGDISGTITGVTSITAETGAFSGLLSSYNNQIIGAGGVNDAYLEFWRGTNASWKVLNSSGVLKFQSNYVSGPGAYYDAMTLSYNSGDVWIKGNVTAPNFIGTASNADKVDNVHVGTGAWSTRHIPTVNTDGTMEIGKYLDFHSDNALAFDYDVRFSTSSGASMGQGTLTITASNVSATQFTGALVGNASTATSATSATNISNTGTVNLASAIESNAITITQPSYSTDKPVKLLNFNWYTDAWSIGNIRSGSTASNGLGIYLNSVEKFRFSDGILKIGTNTVYHTGNIPTWNQNTTGSSATSYKLWTTSHPDDWYLNSAWDGSYFQLRARQTSGSYLDVNVERANNAGYATSAGSASNATNSDTLDSYHEGSFYRDGRGSLTETYINSDYTSPGTGYVNLASGGYSISHTGYGGLLVSLRGSGGSNSGLELMLWGYDQYQPLKFRNSIDSNRYSKSTWDTIWSSRDSNGTGFDWSAKNLTLNGTLSGATTGSFSSTLGVTGQTTLNGGLVVRSVLNSGGSNTGYYRQGYDNIILTGHTTSGVSGIFFKSSLGDTAINHPSDMGWIQFHPYNIDGTGGESNKLVIGVNNDADDMIYLSTPAVNGLKAVYGGTTVQTIYHAGNFSVTLNGSSTTSANFYAPTSQLSVQSGTNSYLIGASSTTSLGTVYSNSGIYMNGSKLYTGDIQASGNITASNLWGISSKDVSLTLTTDWQDTGILMNDSTLFSSGSGTYIIELYTDANGVSAQYSMRYSGIMAVFTSATNSTDVDEITLHSMGHASNGRHIYLRTVLQTTPNYAKIQIATSAAWTGAGTITIKTRRII